MADQELDRNLAATPYKLQEAHKRGQVAKSSELVSVAVLAVAAIYVSASGSASTGARFQLERSLFLRMGSADAGGDAMWLLVAALIKDGMLLLAPLLVFMMLAAIVANVVQTGFVFSGHPLIADWQRVNPAAGFKRLLSMKTVFAAGKTLAKLVLLCLVAYWSLKDLLPHFSHLSALPANAFINALCRDIGSVAFKMVGVLALLALVDALYVRRTYAKDMRMSSTELKREVKQREGDPRIRARLRQLRRELFKRSVSVQRTGEADVVITNPTHIAVALKYEHGNMAAPELVAKGVGNLAAAMRRVAARRGIPVVQNPGLARALYAQTEVSQAVPDVLFAPVARLMVWVIAMRAARNSGGNQ